MVSIWSNVQNLFQGNQHLSPLPNIPKLFPHQGDHPEGLGLNHMDQWANSMQAREDAAHWYIEHVAHHTPRKNGGPQQEFLTFVVSSANNDWKSIVKADRVEVLTDLVRASEETIRGLTQKYSSSMNFRLDDLVWFATKGGPADSHIMNDGFYELRTLVFHAGSRPSVHHLSTLLKVAYDRAGDDHLWHGYQSVWLAHVVFNSLDKIFHPCKPHCSKDNTSLAYTRLRGSIANSVDELCRDYRTAWEEFSTRAERAREAHLKEVEAEARASGRDEGFQEGFTAGLAKGTAEREMLRKEVEELRGKVGSSR
ncbi:hypothetical protein HYDPIDRAFT_105562 [Hydnomerulius pinastri MD-312]|nr:hypothetical protein HYDPIDRAFT_105562 [Hydnomerulius pinastri MD-312]